MKLTLGKITATVTAAGEEMQPWGDRGSRVVYKYRITVKETGKSTSYTCPAWGSIHDYERKKRDYASIGAMVVGELLSAVSDPDEFIEMAMGDAKGKEALKRGRNAEAMVEAAKKFSYAALSKAREVAEERGLT